MTHSRTTPVRPLHRWRRRAALATTALCLTALPALPPTSASAAPRSCGAVNSSGGLFEARVMSGAVHCRTARKITRRYVTSTAPCGGSGCYRHIAGWTCGRGGDTGARLFSCQKGRKRVGAYTIAD